MAEAASAPEPGIRRVVAEGGARVLLSGTWNLHSLSRRLADVSSRLSLVQAEPGATWDLTGIDRLDDAGAVLLWRAWGRRRPEGLALRREHEAFFIHLARTERPPARRLRLDLVAMVAGLGRRILLLADHWIGFLHLLGRTVLDASRVAFRPELWPWREVSASVYRTGAQALG
ncbi:MAG TPA: hypothetical protein VF859_13340, partial [Burkholderiales bacterium]